MTRSAPLYEIWNLEAGHGARDGGFLFLEEMRIHPGEFLGLAGPNGAGKSTLLYVLAFLLQPIGGELRFDGRPVPADATPLRRQATLLLQQPVLLKRSVFDNVAYGLRVRGRGERLRRKVQAALEAVELDPGAFARRAWHELSGGEAQRVALAARLALEPRALLLDEPTASLDTASAQAVRRAAMAARERGCALVCASHDMEWLHSCADRVERLERGRVSESTEET
ncbi:energy-coupling factor ABC transporter ATP-binding protein [Desulfohalovibrio reitneri]|uniref:energy-coupling factor ABC transporter ATP-binding protein n=1 Tax=Desulfohalovibrio reitneri TaxID=1307759 RepID=UPI000554A050|nr:ABC transporter ATP-binding protein [Desulfohalovibrio reitneri]